MGGRLQRRDFREGTDRWWGVGREGNRQQLQHEIERREKNCEESVSKSGRGRKGRRRTRRTEGETKATSETGQDTG